MTKTLKFGNEPFYTAMQSFTRQQYAATVRYDDEKNISKDDTIAIVKPNSENVEGYATIKHVEVVELRDALSTIDAYDAIYGLESYTDLISAMHCYYDASITAKTYVKVIIYQTERLEL